MKTLLFIIVSLGVFISVAKGQFEPSGDLSFKSYAPTCFGKNDGFIKISNKNTTKTYMHQAINVNTQGLILTDYKSIDTIPQLPPGIYVILSRFTDTGGQLKEFTSKQITLPDVPKLEIKDYKIISKPSDQLPSNGMISLEISGGVSPYSIIQVSPSETVLLGSSYTSTAQITNLKNDIYTFNVSDNNKCPTVSRTIQIPKDKGLIINPKITYPSCTNNLGRIDFSLSLGTPPYIISYKNIETGIIIKKEVLNDGNAFIEISEYGEYTVEITDESVPQKVEKNIKVTFTKPNCGLLVTYTISSSPTANNSNGGKIDVAISGGIPPYTVTINKTNEVPIQNTYILSEFPISNLAKGDYELTVKDSKGAIGTKSFPILPAYQPPEDSKKAAEDVYNRFLEKYCQIEVKRKRVKSEKTWLSFGWTLLSGTSSLLTSGTTQIVTIGLNVAGNGLLTFTNNDNYEALTRASQIMKANLDVKYLDSPYYIGWDDTKYYNLLTELEALKKIDVEISKIGNLPELKSYSENVKKRKVPEYTKYKVK